jgi:hypothetical protein
MGNKTTSVREGRAARRESAASTLSGLPAEHMLRTGQVAHWLGCSQKKVVSLIDEGSLPHVDLAEQGAARRELRVPVSGLREFIAARTVDARSERVPA